MNKTMPEALSPAEAYKAAHDSAVWAEHVGRGMLHLTGATRLELVNRMSTQAVVKLQDGEGAATVLTTEIGRIIDRPILYEYDDRALLLTGDGHAPRCGPKTAARQASNMLSVARTCSPTSAMRSAPSLSSVTRCASGRACVRRSSWAGS